MTQLIAVLSAWSLVTVLGVGSAFADSLTVCVKDKNGKINRGALGMSPAKGKCKNEKWREVTLPTKKTPTTETVAFGQWLADPAEPVDRFAEDPSRGAGNNDEVLPQEVVIKEGGAVNFAIAGLHNLVIYDDGTKPEDVDTTDDREGDAERRLPGPANGIINDPNGRIFWGQDPRRENVPRDRVEVVKFTKPGTYLVICAVANHFLEEGMWGFVKVLPQATPPAPGPPEA